MNATEQAAQDIRELVEENERLRARVQRLERCLALYADRDEWVKGYWEYAPWRVARAALDGGE